jgi:galactitol-specific phosphotransferase system IIC component
MSAVAVQLCILSLGWLGLHALRAYALYITPVLVCVALALAVLLLATLSTRYGLLADPSIMMGQWPAD